MIPTETQEPVGNSPMDSTNTHEPAGTRRRRTRASWAVEREMIEIPILTPGVPTETQELVGNSPMTTTVTQEHV